MRVGGVSSDAPRSIISTHRSRGELYCITIIVTPYVSLMYRIVGYGWRCVLHRLRDEDTHP